TAYRVDGFRFDLGTILGREADGFDPNAGFFDAIRQDPLLSRLKLISEPWDTGPGGYQLGNHPPGFAEWNGRFRDDARKFWRGDAGQRPEIARRLMGSPGLFDHRRRKPTASINFITAHDGFTLHDLVSYSGVHNYENGEDNQDGHRDNLSANWGTEGETGDQAINAIRGKLKRAFLATLFVSYGTPMLLAGDEMNHTQRGNNNAYCQDNEISWLDWSALRDGSAVELIRFVGALTALRRRYPSLRSTVFRHGLETIAPGIADTAWFDEQGNELLDQAWADPAAHLLALRRAAAGNDHSDATLLLLNASGDDRNFILPEPKLDWILEIDTANPDLERVRFEQGEITVASRSMIVFGAVLGSNE
ncbi:MAG TPA: glycogen debranching enzyme GlgX, partial [Acidiphilium sp.]